MNIVSMIVRALGLTRRGATQRVERAAIRCRWDQAGASTELRQRIAAGELLRAQAAPLTIFDGVP